MLHYYPDSLYPYVYLIHDQTSQAYYIGSRSSNLRKKRSPNKDLGIRYFSSSKAIKQRRLDGHNLKFQIICTADTRREVLETESQLYWELVNTIPLINKVPPIGRGKWCFAMLTGIAKPECAVRQTGVSNSDWAGYFVSPHGVFLSIRKAARLLHTTDQTLHARIKLAPDIYYQTKELPVGATLDVVISPLVRTRKNKLTRLLGSQQTFDEVQWGSYFICPYGIFSSKTTAARLLGVSTATVLSKRIKLAPELYYEANKKEKDWEIDKVIKPYEYFLGGGIKKKMTSQWLREH